MPHNVPEWCDESDACMLREEPANCYVGGCWLDRGEILAVPVARFADELTLTRDLRMALIAVSWQEADTRDISVLLDGAPGDYVPIDGTTWSLQWRPFPSSPRIMGIEYRLGAPDSVQVWFQFEDSACQQSADRCE